MSFMRSSSGGTRRTWLAMALIAVAAIGAGAAARASGSSGQLGVWGIQGTAPGHLSAPNMLAAEEGGSVFVGDRPEGVGSTGAFRLQKFSSTGTFEGSVKIPTPEGEVFPAMVVDSNAHLIYLLRDKTGSDPETGKAMAETVLVYSTIPVGGELKAPTSGSATLPLPTGTTTAIDNPTDMALDSGAHELEIAGENRQEKYVLQRIGTASGTVGPRYTETTNAFGLNENTVSFGGNSGLAVAPNGTSYVVQYNASTEEANEAVTLSPALTSPTKLASFAAGIEHVDIEHFYEGIRDGRGAQVAISADGGTLYFKEVLNLTQQSVPGNSIVFAYSLAGGHTFAVYGGRKSEAHCDIQNSQAGLAPVGANLFVLDQGNEEPVSPYGVKVTEFGPGGTECPAPSAIATIKLGPAEVTQAHAGSTVTLDASASELGEWGERIESVTWKVEGPEPFQETVPSSAAEPLNLKHVFHQEGQYTVRMSAQIKRNGLAPSLPLFEAQPKSLTITAPGSGIAPAITGIAPTHGPAAGGTAVTIEGTELGETIAVDFGSVPAAEFHVVSPTEVTAKAPAGTVGSTVPVTVTTPEGASPSGAATFSYDVAVQTLTVAKSGSGTGTVTSAPAGISCGAVCSASFPQGQTVTLTAAPAAGSTFAGWTGACAGTSACVVTLSAAKTVIAGFNTAGGTQGEPPTTNPPSTGNSNPPSTTKPGGPPTSVGETPAQKLKEKRQKALVKCKKLKGKAKAACVKRANAIGKPKKPAKKPAKKHATHASHAGS